MFAPSQWRGRGPRRCFSRPHRAVGARYPSVKARRRRSRERQHLQLIGKCNNITDNIATISKVSCPLGLVLPLAPTIPLRGVRFQQGMPQTFVRKKALHMIRTCPRSLLRSMRCTTVVICTECTTGTSAAMYHQPRKSIHTWRT